MSRVLIFTASAGAGHISCANAFREALLNEDSNTEVKIVDMYKLSWITSNYIFFHTLISRYYFF